MPKKNLSARRRNLPFRIALSTTCHPPLVQKLHHFELQIDFARGFLEGDKLPVKNPRDSPEGDKLCRRGQDFGGVQLSPQNHPQRAPIAQLSAIPVKAEIGTDDFVSILSYQRTIGVEPAPL